MKRTITEAKHKEQQINFLDLKIGQQFRYARELDMKSSDKASFIKISHGTKGNVIRVEENGQTSVETFSMDASWFFFPSYFTAETVSNVPLAAR